MYKLLLFCFIIMLAGCPHKHNIQKIDEKTEAQLYKEATDLAKNKKYKQAIKVFQEVEDLYPFSDWAIKAQLQSATANYDSGNYSKAAALLDEYVYMYPNDQDIAYVYYLRILSYYAQIDNIKREQKVAYTTLELLKEYMQIFPTSQYSSILEKKMDSVIDHVAAYELSVGKFYLKRGHYISAIKRFEEIENNYSDSNYTTEALCGSMEAYLALGIHEEAHRKELKILDRSDAKKCANKMVQISR
ncbi:outer membrane protein assembly factor BamD [Candidatus Mesenet endosymbiont of Phosphuga atrata]|uniref:outer membrane protein assembly factor BamD n=1 Tax=Candidatus Mesenet endosymbiont of Phosphuga atrata TaxID=3066221 RepID=UPI0030D54BBF